MPRLSSANVPNRKRCHICVNPACALGRPELAHQGRRTRQNCALCGWALRSIRRAHHGEF